MNKKTISYLMAAGVLGFVGLSFGVEKPTLVNEPTGQKVAPDGSEIEKTQGGPLAIPFGGPSNTETKTETPKKNLIGITGKIVSLSGTRVRIKDTQGRTRVFNLTEQTVTIDPQNVSGVIIKKGDTVSVQFDEKNMGLEKIQILQ